MLGTYSVALSGAYYPREFIGYNKCGSALDVHLYLDFFSFNVWNVFAHVVKSHANLLEQKHIFT